LPNLPLAGFFIGFASFNRYRYYPNIPNI